MQETTKFELLRDFYKNIYESKKAKYLNLEDKKLSKKEIKALDKKYNQLSTDLDRIESFNLEDFKDMSIHIDWKKSATWGANPRGKLTVFHTKGYSLEFYENTYKISGCGYCKESTCTADLLNQSVVIKKLILNKIEKLLCFNRNASEIKGLVNKNNLELRESINYGISQYGLNLPKFDGGVGVSCHESILKKLGLSMRKISWSNTSDTWVIEKI
jgi:hypothetical protein